MAYAKAIAAGSSPEQEHSFRCGSPVRIAICDNSGHAFTIQLSRELARRQHSVLHLHFAEFQSPKGPLLPRKDDPATLRIAPISIARPFAKHSLITRRFQEAEVGKRTWERIHAFAPDVVLGANLPIDALRQLLLGCRRTGRPFVLWLQDIYSIAIRQLLTKKYGVIGRALGAYYWRLEKNALAASAAVVVIADDFVSAIRDNFGLPTGNVHVIENWASLDEITPRPRTNDWAVQQQLTAREVVLYTGTLGMKHDPTLILRLAEALRDRPQGMIVITSEGPSADWLKKEAVARKLHNISVLPFQPFEIYADVLGSADVLIAILEAEAGRFSVPSKILSYLCAGRAIVLSAPPENLASRTLAKSGAGMAIRADDAEGFIAAVESLLADPERRALAGRNGRAYAERTFEIGAIADRFEAILTVAIQGKRPGVEH
jgi:colanic acid biosynthesis glycosyl transferase WcaI